MRIMMYNLLVFFMLFSVESMAKIRVVDKSAKKVPEWVGMTRQDYIITSAISPTLEEAKRQCFDNIRKTIIEAVAQNICSLTQSTIQQESMENGITHFWDTYSAQFSTEAAKLPYLNGISESKAEDSYWEKRQDSETKEVTYAYSVKYPFPSLELKKLVQMFQKQDQVMENKLQALETLYDSITSLGEIDKALSDIEELNCYFFDPVRQERTRSLEKDFRSLYSQITLQEVGNQLGDYVFKFVLRGKVINVPQRPQIKSETLAQLRAELQDRKWHILYDYSTCDPMEENKCEVIFVINGKRLTHTFYVDIAQNEIHLLPEKEIYLNAQNKTDSTISNINIRMQVQNKSKNTCILQGIVLEVPGLEMSLYVENLNVVFQGGCSQTLSFIYTDIVRLLGKQNFRKNILQGYFDVVDEWQTRKVKRFSLPFQANW